MFTIIYENKKHLLHVLPAVVPAHASPRPLSVASRGISNCALTEVNDQGKCSKITQQKKELMLKFIMHSLS